MKFNPVGGWITTQVEFSTLQGFLVKVRTSIEKKYDLKFGTGIWEQISMNLGMLETLNSYWSSFANRSSPSFYHSLRTSSPIRRTYVFPGGGHLASNNWSSSKIMPLITSTPVSRLQSQQGPGGKPWSVIHKVNAHLKSGNISSVFTERTSVMCKRMDFKLHWVWEEEMQCWTHWN